MGDKSIVGVIEEITIRSNSNEQTVNAKIDTGASKSSIDMELAANLQLGPVIKSRMVKSAHGSRIRPIVEVEITLAGKKLKAEFTLADRSHMKYRALIGLNVLKHADFLIDPSK